MWSMDRRHLIRCNKTEDFSMWSMVTQISIAIQELVVLIVQYPLLIE